MPSSKQPSKSLIVTLTIVLVICLGTIVVVTTGRGRIDMVGSTIGGDTSGETDHAEITSTYWVSSLEVFVAHPYVVASQPFDCVVHVTLQQTGEPLRSGTVKVQFEQEGNVTETVAGDPSSPGVWIVPCVLANSGSLRMSVRIASSELTQKDTVIEASPLTVYENEQDAKTALEDAADESVAEIHFLKEQQWRVGLRTVVLQARDIAERLVVPGKVVAPHGSEVMVLPPVPGRVMPPPGGRFPELGESVTVGQLLAVIEPSVAGAQSVQMLVNQAQLRTLDAELAAKQLDIEAGIASRQADLELASQEVERLTGLSDDGVVAGKKLIESRYRQKLAQATLQGYERSRDTYGEAQQRLAKFLGEVRGAHGEEAEQDSLQVSLRSPLAGSIVAAEVTAGEFVGDEHLLFRVVDMQKLFIDAEVSEYDLAKVEASSGAQFRLSAYPDRIFPICGPGEGRLIHVGAVVNPESRTVSVRYEVPNADNLLRLGMFADVMIETGRRQNAIVVPRRSVIDDSGEPVVYIQAGGESFERRAVRLGLQDGDHVELREGVALGDRVVVDGAYAIRLSTLAGGVPEHHHHH
jgi:multidrug efflux pump subunit AcrA (membrane-fusion protein)